MWRNRQTHETQNLAVVTSCGFKSHHPQEDEKNRYGALLRACFFSSSCGCLEPTGSRSRLRFGRREPRATGTPRPTIRKRMPTHYSSTQPLAHRLRLELVGVPCMGTSICSLSSQGSAPGFKVSRALLRKLARSARTVCHRHTSPHHPQADARLFVTKKCHSSQKG